MYRVREFKRSDGNARICLGQIWWCGHDYFWFAKFEQQLKALPPSSASPSSGTIENNNENNDSEKQNEITTQLQKLQNRGVVVVDAFEGYAYDNNIR